MVKPLSLLISPCSYKPPTIVDMLGFKRPTPAIISPSPE